MPSAPDGTASWVSLSKRERSIATKFAEGLTYQQIGEALFIAPTTVRTHLAAIYRKLDIHTKAALINLVVAQGAPAAAPGQAVALDPSPEFLDDSATQGRRTNGAPAHAAARVDRRLAAIVVLDVVGYSRLMGRDEAGTLARLKACRREVLEPLLADHRGRIINFPGDSALCEFASVVDAVECAVALQRGMAEREPDLPEAGRIRFRIGINAGDVVLEGGDLYGHSVNVAARLERIAEPGGICVSGRVCEEVLGRLPFTFEDLGEQWLKNIDRPVQAYRFAGQREAAHVVMPMLVKNNLPQPNRGFVGRTAELQALGHALAISGRSAITQPQAITGLGGVGKTQTALAYAYCHLADYDLVWWLHAEIPAALSADYTALAPSLGLDPGAPHQAALVAAIRGKLELAGPLAPGVRQRHRSRLARPLTCRGPAAATF